MNSHKKPLVDSPWLLCIPENIRYLTGFVGSFCWVLIRPNKPLALITDGRYAETATALAAKNGFEFWLYDADFILNYANQLAGELHLENTVRSATLTSLSARFPATTFVPDKSPITRLRTQKTAFEIEQIRKAQTHADNVLEWFWGFVRKGITEREAAWELELQLRQKGAWGLSFPPIVAFGPNTAKPHHIPGDMPLKSGSPILLDCGVQGPNGYCSDVTRMGVCGAPSEAFLADYETLLTAQKATCAKVQAGIATAELDAFCRKKLGAEAQFFTHSLGHGVGLEVHEGPTLSGRSADVLATGNVITIEPGIYRTGTYGMRIEDLIWITENGCAILSQTTKKLRIVPD